MKETRGKEKKQKQTDVIHGPSLLTEHDVYLFKEGSHFQLHEKLGAHLMSVEGKEGTRFAVWAPNAEKVSVMGEFNGWERNRHTLAPRWDGSGIWEGFIPGVGKGELYKYHVLSKHNNFQAAKGDPYALYWEISPGTASKVWDLGYQWNDAKWMEERHERHDLQAPLSIYEVHLGSWRRVAEENNRSLSYLELAETLPAYVRDMGFTHVEFLPVMEHPFFGSWGYQTAGYFAPSSRYGTPQEFMHLVDCLHQNGIGVILDWVPSHFPSDEFGLVYFDGTHLYEHQDPKKGFHPDWQSYIFNYGRPEVQSFLMSSALFWMDKYHADGLRVDAVASMLYLDYSRKDGEWIPNRYGGNENLEAISFLKRFNESIYMAFPDALTIAEESTAWPMVSRPTYVGGLGFKMKWNMGWMHDTLDYFSKDSLYRKYHHDKLTFSIWYAFTENFMLPLSHDEVVHGKGSLMGKMPGDDWRKFANMRLLLGYMFTHPGKKLLFMGAEMAQWSEWAHDRALEWDLLQYNGHRQIQTLISHLNDLYRNESALHQLDFEHQGFEWVDFKDYESSVLSYLRKADNGETALVAGNFTPIPRLNYRVGVPDPGFWKEIMNTDAKEYGGSGHGNYGGVETTPTPSHGQYNSLSLTIPPLGLVVLKKEEDAS